MLFFIVIPSEKKGLEVRIEGFTQNRQIALFPL